MKKWAYGIPILSLIVALDQATKIWIQNNIQLYSANNIITDILRITFIKNPGGAFSTKFGGNSFYITVSIIATLIVIIYITKISDDNKGLCLALFIIISGAIGNLIDRIRIGEVIDWIDIGFKSTRWPTFNIADSAIVIGLIILIFNNSNGKRNICGNACPSTDSTNKVGPLSLQDRLESEQEPNTETHTR